MKPWFQFGKRPFKLKTYCWALMPCVLQIYEIKDIGKNIFLMHHQTSMIFFSIFATWYIIFLGCLIEIDNRIGLSKVLAVCRVPKHFSTIIFGLRASNWMQAVKFRHLPLNWNWACLRWMSCVTHVKFEPFHKICWHVHVRSTWGHEI